MNNLSTNWAPNKMNKPLKQFRLSLNQTLLLSMAVIFLAGCNGKHQPATQVVAKVNNDEISIHQINSALARIPNLSPANVASARKEILDKLINQQLAVQQALDKKLDRSPEVMMMIDASRREILTRAYLSQLVSGSAKPTDEEVKQFYTSHPQLFAERRIYNLQEIALQKPHPSVGDLQSRVTGKSMADIAASLKNDNITFASNGGTRAAEQIAIPILTELAKFKDGETGVIETPEATMIIHIESTQLAPVKEDVALVRIPQFLANQKAKAIINDKFAQLKSQAKIEYMNEFAGISGNAKGGTAAVSTTGKSTTDTKTPVDDSTRAETTIVKGIIGN